MRKNAYACSIHLQQLFFSSINKILDSIFPSLSFMCYVNIERTASKRTRRTSFLSVFQYPLFTFRFHNNFGYSVCASAFRSSVVMSFNLNGFALADDVNHSKRIEKKKQTKINSFFSWTSFYWICTEKTLRTFYQSRFVPLYIDGIFTFLNFLSLVNEFYSFHSFFSPWVWVCVVNAITIWNNIESKKTYIDRLISKPKYERKYLSSKDLNFNLNKWNQFFFSWISNVKE